MSSPLRVAVVGGGAMGGTLAAEAADAGHDVTVVDVSEALVEQVRAHGLTVERPEGTLTATVKAETDPAAVGPVDVAVVFVKAHHTAAAARAMTSLVGPDTVVASLQNGWGNADVLARHLPEERLVMGVTYHSCTVAEPGRLRHTGRGPTVVGAYRPDGDLGPAGLVAGLLTSAGWAAEATAAARTEIWKKLILNAATLPTAALTLLPAGDLGEPGPLLDLVDALAAEAVAVARAQGLDIDPHERIERIHTVLAGAGKGKASMLQDVEGRRKTEVEVVNGAVVAAGNEHGVDVPLNRAMVGLVHGLERSWRL
jgi:2-dehydropantoate 2-reductase